MNLVSDIQFINPELMDNDDYMLVISNHICEFDIAIMYYMNFLSRRPLRFVSDKKVEFMPIISSIARFLDTIFIDRNSTAFDVFDNTDYDDRPIMIFPEGTLYYQPMIEKNQKECKIHHEYKNVLCPKSSGYEYFIDKFKNKKVIDITIKYHFPENMFSLRTSKDYLTLPDFFLKYFPKKIDVLIQKYEPSVSVYEIFMKKESLI